MALNEFNSILKLKKKKISRMAFYETEMED